MKKALVLLLAVVFVVSAFSIEVSIAAGAVGKELELLYQQVEQFHKENPDITVKVLPMPNSSTSRHDLYVTYLASGTPDPTILMVDVIWPAEFEPFVADLTDDYDYFELDKFLPGTVKSVTYNNKIVAIPWFTDAGLLYYRKDLLDKYGYDVPETWEELNEIGKEISEKEGIDGFIWQGTSYEGLTCNVMEFIHSYGGMIIENGEVVIGNEEYKERAIQALEMMDKLVEEGTTRKGVTTYMEEEARRLFQNGDAVFMRNWPYAWPLIQDPSSPTAGKVGIAPLPKGDIEGGRHSATLGGWNLAINGNASSAQLEAAKKFVKFLTSPEQQLKKAIVAGQNPTRESVYQTEELAKEIPFMVDLYDVFINAEPRPVTPIYPEVSRIIWNETYNVINQQKDAEQAVNDLEKQLKELM
ncbi:ABC transporter substrate-binding protein [Geotoga petraea]|uniref:ABC-type glycerol-3-phosphate transport system, substrate-binding protein n=1 Tax=Geotoga petraea TaxID=28234 RepID=A0A1G6QNZ8_9BACT|nr:ABC transporter substrate-binding protein [Geotoga petraea]SDC93476.1 ABC-type glycerol-3-phosphate transport system, substrate-binding protein [Geotoga petraea]